MKPDGDVISEAIAALETALGALRAVQAQTVAESLILANPLATPSTANT